MRWFRCPKCNSPQYKVLKCGDSFRLISGCGYWFEITTKFKIKEHEAKKKGG